jgi:hypothetical protein
MGRNGDRLSVGADAQWDAEHFEAIRRWRRGDAATPWMIFEAGSAITSGWECPED